MKSLKIDFRRDLISGKLIPIEKVKRYIRKNNLVKRVTFYFSEVADIYYRRKYGKSILEVLDKFYDIPRCPITGGFVSCKLVGSIKFGEFSSSAFKSGEMSRYVAVNNKSFKDFVERMKTDRKGAGNPMYGGTPWNRGLTKEEDDRLQNMSELMTGRVTPKEVRDKQSESAKKRKIHGHTGHKHSEESKQIMREKTIQRLATGKFPQTNSKPYRKLKGLLKILFPYHLKEEYPIGRFVFDFKIPGHLIEVQGDYFHCNPNSESNVPKSDVQKKNVRRDEKKRDYVEKRTKYKLIEIWEKDINEDFKEVAKCMRKLRRSLNLPRPRSLI